MRRLRAALHRATRRDRDLDCCSEVQYQSHCSSLSSETELRNGRNHGRGLGPGPGGGWPGDTGFPTACSHWQSNLSDEVQVQPNPLIDSSEPGDSVSAATLIVLLCQFSESEITSHGIHSD